MISEEVKLTLKEIDNLVLNQNAKVQTKQILENSIREYKELILKTSKNLDIVVNALEILRQISDESVINSYRYIEKNINDALSRIFPEKTRQIKLVEGRRGNYPQLEIQLIVENGKTRSLTSCTGHGVTQVISLLSNMCLIVINGGRRFLVLDEVMSGMSGNTLSVISDVLKAFAEIGFQYIIVEHGFIPEGSKVVVLESINDIGRIVDTYTEQHGVYMEGIRQKKGYKLNRQKTGEATGIISGGMDVDEEVEAI